MSPAQKVRPATDHTKSGAPFPKEQHAAFGVYQ